MRKRRDVYYTYKEIKTKQGLPLFLKFLSNPTSVKIVALTLSEEVCEDADKLTKLEKLLSDMFFVGFERADQNIVAVIKK